MKQEKSRWSWWSNEEIQFIIWSSRVLVACQLIFLHTSLWKRKKIAWHSFLFFRFSSFLLHCLFHLWWASNTLITFCSNNRSLLNIQDNDRRNWQVLRAKKRSIETQWRKSHQNFLCVSRRRKRSMSILIISTISWGQLPVSTKDDGKIHFRFIDLTQGTDSRLLSFAIRKNKKKSVEQHTRPRSHACAHMDTKRNKLIDWIALSITSKIFSQKNIRSPHQHHCFLWAFSSDYADDDDFLHLHFLFSLKTNW